MQDNGVICEILALLPTRYLCIHIYLYCEIIVSANEVITNEAGGANKHDTFNDVFMSLTGNVGLCAE